MRTVNMEDTVKIFKSTRELAHFFALKLAAGIRETPESRFFSLALSGGSTPGVAFEYLASNFREHIDWQKVWLFWGDERCVVPDSYESNFRMAEESLLVHISIPASNIFGIKGEADPVTESERYEAVVRQHIPSKHGIHQFDLMMLGLGQDGHTASIFPENIHLFNSDRLFEATENPYNKQKRITATGKMINQARSVVFLVTGESKAEVVARIIKKKDGWEKLPASLVHPQNGQLLWLLDDRAASLLNL